MKNFLKNNPMLPIYLLSSLIGNIILYICFNWEIFEFKNVIFIGVVTIIGFFIGYVIVKLIEIHNKLNKENYEYRKANPKEDEPW